jgi:hypothetical protein
LRSLALFPVVTGLLMGGCAATQDSGRERLLVPSEVGSMYSEVELQANLALIADSNCRGKECDAAAVFRSRVERLGKRLGAAAGALAADSGLAAPRFSITVPGKEDIGTLSSASGNIVVFDGVRTLELSDPALAFLIAREMGHVIAKHHEENTATGIAVSVAVAVLFPVAGLLQGVEAAYTASTLATTATSFAGSRVVRNFYADEQQREADAHAMLILARAGWAPHDVALALKAALFLDGDGWLAELRVSRRWLNAIVSGPLPEAWAVHVDARHVVDIPREHFGPVFDTDTLWIAGLLHGASGMERLCGAQLPAAGAIPAAKPVKLKPVKKPAKKAKKTVKVKKRAKRAIAKRARPK